MFKKKSLNNLLKDEYLSYEEFYNKISRLKVPFSRLNYDEIEDKLKEVKYSYISKILIKNIFFLYRYMLSIHVEENDESLRFYMLLKSLSYLKTKEIDELKKEIDWISYFPSSEVILNQKYIENLNDEYFTELLKKKIPYKDLINLFLIMHLSISELFRIGKIEKITNSILNYINNYIKLVNEYHELEQIFGICIENDMRIIYEYLD